jgi:thioredoxin reductase (NADPH)
MSDPPASSQVRVAVLCAAWCRTCGEFRPLLDALAAARPALRFLWIDIEDDAALCDDLDVDDFPTLAIVRGDVPLFFGAALPVADVVGRLVDEIASREAGDPAAWPAPVRALATAIAART